MLQDLYDAVADDAALASFASTVAGMCAARSANVVYTPRAAPAFQQISYFPDEYVTTYVTGYINKDPWRRVAMAKGVPHRALAMDDDVPPERFVESAIYNDLLKRLGDDTGRCMGIEGMFGDAHLHIAVHRPLTGRPFSIADRRRLEETFRHAAKVMQLRASLDGERTLRRRSEAMLEAAGTAVLLVDRAFRVLGASPAAIAVLDSGDGLSHRNGRLVIADSAAATDIRRAAAELIERVASRHSSVLCQRRSGRPSYRLVLAPAALGPDAGLTIAIDDPCASQPSRLELLCAAYHLTPSEMRVTEQLLAGALLEDVAQLRNVSIETVRAQLKSIFLKTQTHRQIDLVRLFS